MMNQSDWAPTLHSCPVSLLQVYYKDAYAAFVVFDLSAEDSRQGALKVRARVRHGPRRLFAPP